LPPCTWTSAALEKSSIIEWVDPPVGSNATKCRIISPDILEKLELAIRDGLCFFKYTPLDAFSARRSRQRPVVAPELGEVKAAKESFDIGVLSSKLCD